MNHVLRHAVSSRVVGMKQRRMCRVGVKEVERVARILCLCASERMNIASVSESAVGMKLEERV